MSATSNPSPLNAAAAAFFPGQSAHPSPAPSERFSSPSPPLSAVNFQFQSQQYFGPQKHYGYQPFPIFNGYTQAYEFQATLPPYSTQPQGAASWYPQQNGHVGYAVNSQEPFNDQFKELQGVRNGHIPSQNTWYHYGTGNYITKYSNDVPEKVSKKNKRKKFNRSNKEVDHAEEHKVQHPAEAKARLRDGCRETETGTKVKTDTNPATKAASIIGGQD